MLNVTACLALKAMGHPQDLEDEDGGYTQAWLIPQPDWDIPEPVRLFGYAYDDGTFAIVSGEKMEVVEADKWVACPDSVDALGWLTRHCQVDWKCDLPPYWVATLWDGSQVCETSVSHLIIAAAAHWKLKQP